MYCPWIAPTTTLGTALATLQPTELSQTSLQQGETTQLQKILDKVIQQHVGGGRTVVEGAIRLDKLSKGWIRFYRPLPFRRAVNIMIDLSGDSMHL